jgi:hypothetical protein
MTPFSMTMAQLLGVAAGLGLVAFIVCAFRQGMQVTPDNRTDRGPSVGSGDGGPP